MSDTEATGETVINCYPDDSVDTLCLMEAKQCFCNPFHFTVISLHWQRFRSNRHPI